MGTPGVAPARLGRYELLARLATGGMGEIFLARLDGAEGFAKLFVVKRILPHLADDPRFRAMLVAEARIASMMTHANICHVYELGETDGQLYIVMEYLEGVSVLPLLRKVSRAGSALELGFVGGVIQQATDGLHYAHELKDRSGASLAIVHRDVTPSNLFLTEAGVVKVLDFGIAKVKDASAHTQTGTVKGKYAYMAPEQLRGVAVDRRVDVFAVGVVLYEMLALRRLFQRKTDYLTFRAVMEQPIADIRRYRPDCPEALVQVIARALDRNPANRYDTARQLGAAVVDAIAPVRRPWTQGEIGDLVASQFAAELARRGALIASALPGSVGTGPVILSPEDDGDDDEDVDEGELGEPRGLRSVDAMSPTLAAAPRRASAESLLGEPAVGRSPSAPTVVAPAPVVVVDHRRSLMWPLVAFAMVAIASGALFLVWRQMQEQRPTSVVITNGTGGEVTGSGSNTVVVGPRAPIDAPEVGMEAVAVDAGAGSATVERPAHRDKDPYLPVVLARKADANKCAADHGNPPPGTHLQIVVAPDGRPRAVTITPSSVEATPLGGCIKAVFLRATFPRGDEDHTVSVTLIPPSRAP
jgi:hypothetical protein